MLLKSNINYITKFKLNIVNNLWITKITNVMFPVDASADNNLQNQHHPHEIRRFSHKSLSSKSYSFKDNVLHLKNLQIKPKHQTEENRKVR